MLARRVISRVMSVSVVVVSGRAGKVCLARCGACWEDLGDGTVIVCNVTIVYAGLLGDVTGVQKS